MKKKFLIPAALCLMMATLSGCGGTVQASAQGSPSAVCYAVANTANAQGLNFSSPAVQDSASEAISGFGYVSVVNVDGSPEVLMAESFDIPAQYKKASSEKLKADAQANTAALLQGLSGIAADDPEVDFLEGLRLAARSLSSLEGYDRKTIFMLGTGLSTTGTLDFNNNLLLAEPEQVVALLKERSEIPDLKGITVIWQQLGDVAAPQQALTQAQRQKLAALWQNIVEAGGGSFRCSDFLAAAKPEGNYPAVSAVELPMDDPIRFDPQEPEPELLDSPLVLTEDQVQFKGDEAVYLHPDQAAEILKPIAEYLAEHPEKKILLAGTTAGDNDSPYTLRLSRERAETVRNTFIALGISADRITAVGLGSSDPWHISGVGTNGELAKANRKVVILDAESAIAAKLQ